MAHPSRTFAPVCPFGRQWPRRMLPSTAGCLTQTGAALERRVDHGGQPRRIVHAAGRPPPWRQRDCREAGYGVDFVDDGALVSQEEVDAFQALAVDCIERTNRSLAHR